MDARQQFKFAFLNRCVESGLTSPALILGAVKAAVDKHGLFDGAMKLVNDLGGKALGLGLGAAAVAPPLLGGIAGTMAAKATDVDDFDVEEAKRQEVIDEYTRQTARLNRLGLVRRHEAGQQRTGRAFM